MKVCYEVSSRKHLLNSKGVHREMESERLPVVKSRSEEYELHIRPYNLDEFASQDKIKYCQKMVW